MYERETRFEILYVFVHCTALPQSCHHHLWTSTIHKVYVRLLMYINERERNFLHVASLQTQFTLIFTWRFLFQFHDTSIFFCNYCNNKSIIPETNTLEIENFLFQTATKRTYHNVQSKILQKGLRLKARKIFEIDSKSTFNLIQFQLINKLTSSSRIFNYFLA